MKKILMLLGDYAEDYEVMVPYQILRFACFEVDCVAPDNKPMAVICHGVQILTAADLVRDRKLTCYPAVGPGIYALMQQFTVLLLS